MEFFDTQLSLLVRCFCLGISPRNLASSGRTLRFTRKLRKSYLKRRGLEMEIKVFVVLLWDFGLVSMMAEDKLRSEKQVKILTSKQTQRKDRCGMTLEPSHIL